MKGVILAGGAGTRLHPVTVCTSKQLLPVYDKPMIYYPISTLMLAGIREILVITTPHDSSRFQELLGDGSSWGLTLEYAIQPKPEGLAQALIIAKVFLAGGPCALILGDNLFYGHRLPDLLSAAKNRVTRDTGASLFAYHVSDPERFGVVEFGNDKRALSLEEKPSNPKSNYAVTGLYFYDGRASDFSESICPSDRGELEITDLNKLYLEEGSLSVEIMGRGFAWLDTGTHDSLLDASSFISTIQARQGLQVACPEEIAYLSGWISADQLLALSQPLLKSKYGEYLRALVKE